jgi:hypothetical protein
MLVVWVGVLAIASASIASAALAIAAHPGPACAEDGSAEAASGSATAARGDEQAREPASGDAEEVPIALQHKGGHEFAATVPVYIHVVTPDGIEGNVPLSKVREQVRVLTLSFGGAYGGVDTGFSFRLVSADWTVNADWYNAGPNTKGEREMKQALHQGGPDALNIYLTTAGIYLGWAYFPSIVKSESRAYLDGIVVDWKSLPGMGLYPNFDLGFTATHEAGHWLNLYHTFQGGCNHNGDYVDDTPPQRTPSFGCPEGKDTCSDPGLDPIHNYMDYSDDPCYNQFTQGQAGRMRDAWNFWRE